MTGREERGSVSVLAAGVMVMLVVMALATADVAHVLRAAAIAQTAADAAALGAAQELAAPSGREPGDVAAEYAERDGAELLSCRCEAGSDEAVVEVRIVVRNLLFLPGDRTVTARARAVVDFPVGTSAGRSVPHR